MWGCSVWGSVMAFKDSHVWTVRKLRIGVQIIFESNTIKECFEIKGLLCTNDVKSCCFFHEWESLTCDGCCKHSNTISTSTIAYFIIAITICTSWPWNTSDVWVLKDKGVIIDFMCVPEGDTSFVVSEEHIAVLYSLMAAWGVRHETDLTSVPNAAFCSKTSLIL